MSMMFYMINFTSKQVQADYYTIFKTNIAFSRQLTFKR